MSVGNRRHIPMPSSSVEYATRRYPHRLVHRYVHANCRPMRHFAIVDEVASQGCCYGRSRDHLVGLLHSLICLGSGVPNQGSKNQLQTWYDSEVKRNWAG